MIEVIFGFCLGVGYCVFLPATIDKVKKYVVKFFPGECKHHEDK